MKSQRSNREKNKLLEDGRKIEIDEMIKENETIDIWKRYTNIINQDTNIIKQYYHMV